MGGGVCDLAVPRRGDPDRRAIASRIRLVRDDERLRLTVGVERLERVDGVERLDRVDGIERLDLVDGIHVTQLGHLVQFRLGVAGDFEPILMSLPASEAVERFECFGGQCAVLVQGAGPAGSPSEAAVLAKRRLLAWHGQFSRFERSSELSMLNRDPRETVPVSAMMARFIEAALQSAAITGGLVDPTLVDEIEGAGYGRDFAALAASPADSFRRQPRRPAAPNPASRWREVAVDRRRSSVSRPVGVRLDSGGIAKGLFGDVLAGVLSWHQGFAVEAAGDVRLGGTAALKREVQITSPFHADAILHCFKVADSAVATSGITKRSWIDGRGRVAHHLLDPATGQPAFTGIVQATALAPSGVEAEALAKAALLSGPGAAAARLRHGGVLVYEDETFDVIAPATGERCGPDPESLQAEAA